MGSKLHLNLLTGAQLESTLEARRLFEIWVEHLPNFIFERFGIYEPLRGVFDRTNIDDALALWGNGFSVKKTKPRLSGSFFDGGGKIPTHGWIAITLDFRQTDQDEILTFAKKLAIEFKVQFGLLHLMTQNEFKGNDFSKGVFWSSPQYTAPLDVTTHKLRKCIPNLYWGTFLGSDYVRFFGEAKFKTLPTCVSSEPLAEELYYLQMSEKLVDLETQKLSSINACREEVKKHLDNDAFYDAERFPELGYRVPTFESLISREE